MVSESNSSDNTSTLDRLEMKLNEEANVDSLKRLSPHRITNSELRTRIQKRLDRYNYQNDHEVHKQIQRSIENIRKKRSLRERKKHKKLLRKTTRQRILR